MKKFNLYTLLLLTGFSGVSLAYNINIPINRKTQSVTTNKQNQEILVSKTIKSDREKVLAIFKKHRENPVNYLKALKNNPTAYLYLGISVEEQSKDYLQAMKYYELAAKQGEPVGWVFLGDMYAAGRGVKKDFNKAESYYKKAITSKENMAVDLAKEKLNYLNHEKKDGDLAYISMIFDDNRAETPDLKNYIKTIQQRAITEAKKDPVSTQEAVLTFADVSGLIVKYVTTDPETLKEYNKKDGVPCEVIKPSAPMMSKINLSQCKLKDIPTGGVITGIKGISVKAEEILERITEGLEFSYKDGSFYMTPDKQTSEARMNQIMNDMDMKAAENGDSYAMGLVANKCLKAQNYICAYKWASLALTSSYWWQIDLPTNILKIRDEAKDNLKPTEYKVAYQQVLDYISPRVEKLKEKKPLPPDNTKTLPKSELKKQAENLDIYAAGNYAKLCLKEKDYQCAYKYSTFASMGNLYWGQGEEILKVRDEARKHLLSVAQVRLTHEIENRLLHCPEAMPLKHEGQCVSCENLDVQDISEKDCGLCENREFKNGKCGLRNGIFEIKRDDGNVLKIPYVNGIISGNVNIYDETGYLKQISEFKDGKENGTTTIYNAKKEIISTIPFKNGIREGVGEYFPLADGKPETPYGVKHVQEYHNGKLNGINRVYFANGQLKQETQWKDGKEDGFDRLYGDDGALLLESVFKDGQMIQAFCYTSTGEKRELTGYAFTNYARGGIDRTCDE